MVWGYRSMHGRPGSAMTRRTVAANTEGLTTGTKRCYQNTACGVMAVGAIHNMRISTGTGKGISMTACTVIRAGCRYKSTMIRCRRMDRAPRNRMTRRTVAATTEGLTTGTIRRYQRTVGIMTRGTRIMRISCSAYQRCCCMTVKAACGANYCY